MWLKMYSSGDLSPCLLAAAAAAASSAAAAAAAAAAATAAALSSAAAVAALVSTARAIARNPAQSRAMRSNVHPRRLPWSACLCAHAHANLCLFRGAKTKLTPKDYFPESPPRLPGRQLGGPPRDFSARTFALAATTQSVCAFEAPQRNSLLVRASKQAESSSTRSSLAPYSNSNSCSFSSYWLMALTDGLLHLQSA